MGWVGSFGSDRVGWLHHVPRRQAGGMRTRVRVGVLAYLPWGRGSSTRSPSGSGPAPRTSRSSPWSPGVYDLKVDLGALGVGFGLLVLDAATVRGHVEGRAGGIPPNTQLHPRPLRTYLLVLLEAGLVQALVLVVLHRRHQRQLLLRLRLRLSPRLSF